MADEKPWMDFKKIPFKQGLDQIIANIHNHPLTKHLLINQNIFDSPNYDLRINRTDEHQQNKGIILVVKARISDKNPSEKWVDIQFSSSTEKGDRDPNRTFTHIWCNAHSDPETCQVKLFNGGDAMPTVYRGKKN